MSNKQPLNEFSLTAILGSLFLFAWVSGFFSTLANKIDAYYNGRDVKINNALKKIVAKLGKSKSFIQKIDNFVQKHGIGESMVIAIMNTSDVKNALNAYEGNKEINFEELTTELSIVLSKAMYDEIESRNIVNKLDKKIKNTNWA